MKSVIKECHYFQTAPPNVFFTLNSPGTDLESLQKYRLSVFLQIYQSVKGQIEAV